MKKEGFTKTELEVLKLIVSGYSNPKIAELLFVSEKTVKTHISRIYYKAGIDKSPDVNQRVLLVHNILEKLRGKNEDKR